jgi:hypothetical protein
MATDGRVKGGSCSLKISCEAQSGLARWAPGYGYRRAAVARG